MNLFILIAGMTAVTYIPRLIPFLLIRDRRLPPYIRRFLEILPVAALGALIFPGVIGAVDPPWIGITAAFAAWLIAWFRGGMILAVASGVGIAYLLLAYAAG